MTSLEWLLYASLLVLLANWVQYLICLSRKSSFEGHWLLPGTLLGFGGLSLYLALRWMFAGHPPLTTPFEIFVLFSWSILTVFLLLCLTQNLKPLGNLVLPTMLLFLLLAQVQSQRMVPESELGQMFQTRGAWVHIFLIVLAYGAFTVAFLIALGYLRAEYQLRAKSVDGVFFMLPPLEVLDRGLQRSMWIGVVSLLAGVGLGALQGVLENQWSLRWFLDPNIGGAFLTALIFGAILVLRQRSLFTNRRIAYLTLVGFALIVFLFLVMYYLSTLHWFL